METIYKGVFILVTSFFICVEVIFAQDSEPENEDTSLDSLLNIKVSTAAKYWQTSSEAPASVTLITSKQIERYGYRTLDEVLRTVRGFYTSNDRNYSYVGVRGFSRPTDYNDRLLLLIDGHTMNENVYGSALVGNEFPIDPRSIDHIEIVRGPGSSLYGTGAMFAVVNLITKKGNSVDGLSVSADIGSFNRYEANVLYGKQFGNNAEVLVSLHGGDVRGEDLYYREFDDPATNNGIAEHLDWERYAGMLASVQRKNLSLLTILTTRTKGVPTGAYGVVFNDPSAKSIDKRGFIEFKYDRPFAMDKNIMIRAYFDYYNYFGSYPYPSVMNYDASTGKWIGGELQYQWDLFPGNRLTLGTEYKNNFQADYRNWATDTVLFDRNFPFNVFSTYVQDEFQIVENFSITLGVRRDEYSTVGSSTTPRVAVIFNPYSSGTLKLLYGEGFRAPHVYETNYEDELTGWILNPTLRPEKIRTTEVVWEQRLSDDMFGIVSFYNYTMNDLIDPVKDSVEISQFQNISEVEANGIETEINFRTDFGLQGYASFVYQQAKDPLAEEQISNSPASIFRFGLSYQLSHSVFLSSEFRYTSERISVYRTTIEPYGITNLNLLVKPRMKTNGAFEKILSKFDVSFHIKNMFNVSYATPGGIEHIQDAIPQDGRSYHLRIGYSL